MTPALKAINKRIRELRKELREAADGRPYYSFSEQIAQTALDEAVHLRALVKKHELVSLSQLKRIECQRGKK